MRYVVWTVVAMFAFVARAESLDEQVEQLIDEGKYTEAEPLAIKALANSTATQSQSGRMRSVANLTRVYFAQRKYDLAEPLAKQGLAATEKASGADAFDTADWLIKLGLIYKNRHLYDLA